MNLNKFNLFKKRYNNNNINNNLKIFNNDIIELEFNKIDIYIIIIISFFK